MLLRPPRERPIVPNAHTQLHFLSDYNHPLGPVGDLRHERSYYLAPTTEGLQAHWALLRDPHPDNPIPFMWLCLTHIDHEDLGPGECGRWRRCETSAAASEEAANHAFFHDRCAEEVRRRGAGAPPSTSLNPTEEQVEVALETAQTGGPCPEEALIEPILRAHRAEGTGSGAVCTTVSRRHLQIRLTQLMAGGRARVRQEQEWRALTGTRWPSTSPHQALWATCEQGERWVREAVESRRGIWAA
ncbi:hypothetical protein ACIQU4_27765 [Streptomyces sp. NPDC090741]|uniref:hypothetical protein n=1 Tax=Streptomyces sp. NPDC090741 TaxID=3365967 RepID=UPI00380FA0B6